MLFKRKQKTKEENELYPMSAKVENMPKTLREELHDKTIELIEQYPTSKWEKINDNQYTQNGLTLERYYQSANYGKDFLIDCYRVNFIEIKELIVLNRSRGVNLFNKICQYLEDNRLNKVKIFLDQKLNKEAK